MKPRKYRFNPNRKLWQYLSFDRTWQVSVDAGAWRHLSHERVVELLTERGYEVVPFEETK